MKNYQILGLESTATIAEVKAKFKKLSLIHHPDRGGDTNMFIKVRQAYEEILEPKNPFQTNTESRYKRDFEQFKTAQEMQEREYQIKMEREQLARAQREYAIRQERKKGRYTFGKISLVGNAYRFEIVLLNIYSVAFFSGTVNIKTIVTYGEDGRNYFYLTKKEVKEANYLIKIKLLDLLDGSVEKEFKITPPPTFFQKIIRKINNLLG